MQRFYSKVWENFKEYIILVILLVVSLVTLSLNSKPEVKNIRSVAFSAFASVTSLISDLMNITQLRNENENLRKINSELMLKVNMMRRYAIENKELKGLLTLRDSTKYPLISSTIVSRSLSNTQNTITINAGTSQGVKPGMPVIDDIGMVGIVYSTSDNYSIVRTLHNIDLKLTVKDERSRANAIMKWNGSFLAMVNVPKTYDIEQGDSIITSEISSIVPVPLPIGVVRSITKMETGIFNDVTIIPFVNFDKIENVFVLGIVESKEKNGLELNFYKKN
jgi:rod shape-determining protein MreC